MTSSPQPCPTCAAPHTICCVAENMQHQTHSRSPLTHEDMLERDRSEVGFVSSFSPAASPSRARPRGARSLVPFSPLLPRTYPYSMNRGKFVLYTPQSRPHDASGRSLELGCVR